MIRNTSGQTLTEYVLLLSVVVSSFYILNIGLSKMEIGKKFTKSITESFSNAYRNGHVKGKGYEDGGPEYHPRARAGGTNFRLFINPRKI